MLGKLVECYGLGTQMNITITVDVFGLDRGMLARQAGFLVPEAYGWFPDYLSSVKRQLKLVRGKLDERVRLDGPVATALFDMAILVVSRITSETTISNLRFLAQIAGLAAMPLERYIDGICHEDASNPECKEVDRLHKAVEQELTNRLADELDTMSTARDVDRANSTA